METEGKTGGDRGQNGWQPRVKLGDKSEDDLVDYLRISAPRFEHMRTSSTSEIIQSEHHDKLPNAASKDGRRPSAADDPKSHHFMRPKMSAASAVPHLGRGTVTGQPIGRSRPSYATARAARPRPRPPACPRAEPGPLRAQTLREAHLNERRAWSAAQRQAKAASDRHSVPAGLCEAEARSRIYASTQPAVGCWAWKQKRARGR